MIKSSFKPFFIIWFVFFFNLFCSASAVKKCPVEILDMWCGDQTVFVKVRFENCGKNAHHYADYSETVINGEKMTEYGSCYIFPVNFEMRVDSVFLALINERREISEQGVTEN